METESIRLGAEIMHEFGYRYIISVWKNCVRDKINYTLYVTDSKTNRIEQVIYLNNDILKLLKLTLNDAKLSGLKI